VDNDSAAKSHVVWHIVPGPWADNFEKN